jgi:tripartite-type tricarboxylate transporter receptor subunit TctC
MAIAVHPIEAKSLQELIKRVKAAPGKFSYGSCGTGSICHVTGELFKGEAGGLDIVHVPFRSSGESVAALVAGQVPIVIGTISSLVNYHKSGQVRILAVFSEKRSTDIPDVPTATELGMPHMIAATFNVLLAPAGTPKQVIDILYEATRKVVSDKAFQKQLENIGVDPIADSNPEKAALYIKSEIARWEPVIKASGLMKLQ